MSAAEHFHHYCYSSESRQADCLIRLPWTEGQRNPYSPARFLFADNSQDSTNLLLTHSFQWRQTVAVLGELRSRLSCLPCSLKQMQTHKCTHFHKHMTGTHIENDTTYMHVHLCAYSQAHTWQAPTLNNKTGCLLLASRSIHVVIWVLPDMPLWLTWNCLVKVRERSHGLKNPMLTAGGRLIAKPSPECQSQTLCVANYNPQTSGFTALQHQATSLLLLREDSHSSLDHKRSLVRKTSR